MSILLTDEAVQAAWRTEQPTTYASIIETFLRYHATEGREALVDALARRMWDHEEAEEEKLGAYTATPWENANPSVREVWIDRAELVVDALTSAMRQKESS